MKATTITNLDWFKKGLSEFGESLDDIESISLSDEEMAVPVGWGGVSEGLGKFLGLGLGRDREFLAWSKDYVYFEICYDDHYKWIRRVPRNPQLKINLVRKFPHT